MSVGAHPSDEESPAGYPAGAYPIVPPLPEHETETTTPNTKTETGGTETKQLSPEQAAAMARTEAVGEQQIGQTEEVKKQKEMQAWANKAMADESERVARENEAQHNAATDKANTLLDARRADYAKKLDIYEKTPTEKFFRDGDTWGNARRGLGLALGGIGDAMRTAAMMRVGMAPPKMDTVGEIIESDLAQQRAHIGKLKDSVAIARTGIQDAEEAKKNLMADVDLKGAEALKRLEAKTRSLLAAAGMSQPEIDQHQSILEIKKGIATYQQNYLAPTFDAIKKGFSHETGTTTRETNRQGTTKAPAPAPEFDAGGNRMGDTPLGPETARKVNTELGFARQAKTLIDKLQASYAKGIKADPAEIRSRQADIDELKTIMPQLKGFSRLTHEEMDAFKSIVGSHLDAYVPTDSARRLLTQLGESVDSMAEKNVRASGVQPTPGMLGAHAPAAPPAAQAPTQPPPFVPASPGGSEAAAPGGAPPPPPPLKPQDELAVRLARRRLAANPNDAVAKRTLEVNGLEQ